MHRMFFGNHQSMQTPEGLLLIEKHQKKGSNLRHTLIKNLINQNQIQPGSNQFPYCTSNKQQAHLIEIFV